MHDTTKGQSLVELLLAIAIAAIILPALLTGIIAARSGKDQQLKRAAAQALMQQTTEAVRNVRNAGWDPFAVNGTYHPETNGIIWSLVPGGDTVSGINRSVVIADVMRDGSGAIVASGGTNDPSTKKVTITLSWTLPRPSNIESTLYFTRYKDNLTYTETTEADFNAGTAVGTAITNTAGGEVILGSGGSGSWCAPDLTLTTLDLPKSGVANAISAIEGRVFAGTGENASGVSFAYVTVDNNNPPGAGITGSYDCCKTNDIFGENNYVYLATDTNTKEIIIVQTSTLPYSEIGYFDAPGNGDGSSVYVQGSVGYMISGSNLYAFNLSSKSGSRGQLGSVDLGATGRSVFVVGSYAYVAVDGSTQLKIVNISSGILNGQSGTLSVVATAAVSGGNGKDVYVNETGTRAYLATAGNASQKEVFIIDTSTKSGSRPTVGSYETNGMDPKGITVVAGNKTIVVGTGAEEYQVIDITNDANPSRCGGIEVDSGINGVASVIESDGDAYSYIITGDASSELKIIAGGPGGGYSASGTFESATFTAGYQTAFNRIIYTADTPSQTTLTVQVAVADAVAGSCNGVTYEFLGPDKTAATYYDSEMPIVLDDDSTGYENPGRCMRYKAYLDSGDSSQTPILYDVTVNYSP